MMQFQDG